MSKRLVAFACFVLSALTLSADSLKKPTEGNDYDCSVTKTVSVKRGEVHTFWVTGLSSETAVYSLDVFFENDDCFIWPMQSVDTYDDDGNLTGMYVLLSAEDWEDADGAPSSCSFKCIIDGWYDEDVSANNKFTFGHATGDSKFPYEEEPEPEPEPEYTVAAGSTEGTAQTIGSPRVLLLPGTDASYAGNEFKPNYEDDGQTVGGKTVTNGTYPEGFYYSITLTAGQKYIFGIVTNKASASLTFSVYNKTDSLDLVSVGEDYANYWPDCTMPVSVKATRTGLHYVRVTADGFGGVRDAGWTSLRCVPIKARSIAEHNPKPVSVGSASDPFEPGYVSDPGNRCSDDLIDEYLFEFSNFSKNENFIFRTEGAPKTNLIMRLYNAGGTIIAENFHRGLLNGVYDRNVQLAWTPTTTDVTAKKIYIGVAQNLAEGETRCAKPGEVRLIVERVNPVNENTAVTAVPGDEPDPRACTEVRPSAPRSLGTNEWVNTFVLATRANTSYTCKLRECGADASVSNQLSIGATAYTLSSGKRTELSTDPAVIGPSADGYFTFTTGSSHGLVYIDVTVSDTDDIGKGKGLAFGPYELYAVANLEADVTGLLEVRMKGAPQDKMGWKLLKLNGKSLSSEVFYEPGTGVAVPTGTYVVAAQTVSGFATPPSAGFDANVEVRPWAPDRKSATTLYKYTDTSDFKDDYPQGKGKDPVSGKDITYAPVAITPSATFTPLARTLWDNDVADNFKFTANEASFYKFIVANEKDKELCPGTASFTITNAEYATVIKDATYAAQVRLAKSSKPYILTVAHGGKTEDASYTLTAVAYSPTTVTPSAAGAKSANQTLNYGEKYYKAKLVAGRKYHFEITADSAERIEQIVVFPPDGEAPKYNPERTEESLSFDLYPAVDGDYIFDVRGGDESLKTGTLKFTFVAQVAAERKFADHTRAAQTMPAVSADGTAEMKDVKPGYVNTPANVKAGYWDGVVDDLLVKVQVPAKKSYLVETVGATKDLVMYVYNSSGKLLKTNYSNGTDFDLRTLFEAANSAQTYYVGVAEVVDEIGGTSVPQYLPVTLRMREVAQADEAKALMPIPEHGGEAATVKLDPEGCAGTSFASNRWTQTFAIAARKGLTYRFLATTNGAQRASSYRLKASVYTLSGATKKYLAAPAVRGDLTPGADGLVLAPTANAMHYVEIEVLEGRSLDYPAITVHSSAHGADDLGVLCVRMYGVTGKDAAKMQWKLTGNWTYDARQKKDVKKSLSGEPWYDNSAWLVLPAGKYCLGAQTISNFAVPVIEDQTVGAYTGAVAVIDAPYTDKADPLDNDPDTSKTEQNTGKKYAPTKLSPSATKPATGSHTLWKNDPADWYVIPATAGNFYRIELTETTGNPAVRVFGPGDWTKEVAYSPITNNTPMVHTEAVQFCAAEKGNYYVKVFHGDAAGAEKEWIDSTYFITASMYAPGQVKLTKTEYSVKNNAAYVDVGVSRTGDGGTVRVKFRTVAITAQPNTEYYPTNGVIEWFAKDKKERKIRVNLIPDIVPTWASSNLEFKVQFETFTAGEREYPDEFIPSFANGQTVTVKLTETAKKTPGTITADYLIDGKPGVFENPKKPTVTVKRGETLALLVRREPGASGANGAVGVKVSAKDGTAKAGTDYNDPGAQTKVWEDASTNGVCTYTVLTKTLSGDHTASKAFTINLKALTARPEDSKAKLDKATLAASSVAVTILNPDTRTVTDYFKDKETAAALKAMGITGLKESKAGTWVIGKDGGMTCVNPGDLSFTLVGPGRFSFTPFVADGGTMSWSMGSGRTAQGDKCKSNEPVVVYVPSGTQTLKITATKDCKLLAKDGVAYEWLQLPVVTMLPYLVDKAVVAAGEVEFRISSDDWALTNAAYGVGYRVYALSEGACWTNDAKKVVKYKLGDPETEILADKDGAYKTSVWYDAKVNKGKWTFRVDSFFVGGTVTNAPKSAWSFTVADTSKLPGGAKLADTAVGGKDVKDVLGYGVNGAGVAGQGEYGKIYLRRLVKVDIPVGGEQATVTKVTGNLPAGVSLKAVEVRKDGKTSVKRYFLTGTPTKAGEYPLVLRETAKYGNVSVAGTTTAFTLVVADAGTVEGTFNGLVFASYKGAGGFTGFGTGDGTDSRLQTIAQVQITAASNGKLSGKMTVAGKSYTFTDTGYTSIRYLGPKDTKPEDDPTGPFEYTGVMTQIQKPYTNVMTYTFTDLPKTTNLVWQGSNSVGAVVIKMTALPPVTGSEVQNDVTYQGDICRDNSAIKEWAAEAAKCAGYYTVALAPVKASDVNLPHGNGYMTLTLDAKGKAKLAGQLADGAAYSASSVAAAILDAEDGVRVMKVPLFAFKKPTVFGGWLAIRFPEGVAPTKHLGEYDDPNAEVPVVLCDGLFDRLFLRNDDPLTTCDGENGYDLEITPVGGWYDKVINLQRYYRSADYTNNTFSVDTAKAGDDDFEELRRKMQEISGTNYEFVAAASADGLAVDLTGDALSVEKQKLVKYTDAKGKATSSNDWSQCVNPANVSVKFTRATGILTGTCDLWYEGWNRKNEKAPKFEQLKYSGCKHAGVLLLSRGDDPLASGLPADIWTAGAVIVPQKVNYEDVNGKTKTRTWNASFRFNVIAAPAELPKE